MPDEDVTLVVSTRPKTPSTYSIAVVNDKNFEIDAPESAKSGETVQVTITVAETFFKVGSVRYNDRPCTYLSDEGAEYFYEFTMPAQDVTLTATVEEDLHPITPIEGEHTTLAILNCHYNYGTPDHVIQASQYTLVRFRYEVDLGYDIRYVARGESGQEIEIGYNPKDESYGACWFVQMPDEPLTIETVATEKTVYDGKDFVGIYNGIEFFTSGTGLVSGAAPTLAMDLKANASFTVTSTDRNAFDFDGNYTYDEAADKFDCIRETCKKTYGILGWRIGGDMFIRTNNLLEDKPDHNRYYFTARGAYEYTCAASDSYDQRFLLEIRRGADRTYYYVDMLSYTWDRVDVAFDDGSSIGDRCSALVSRDGTPLFRYVLGTDATAPEFRFKGNEAGSYRLQEGSGPDLTLDGFGGASVGDTPGSYTIEKGIVNFTTDEKTTKYLIDTENYTYYEVQSDEAWDGTMHFYAESDYGYNSDVSSTEWVKGWVYLDMDIDYSGNPKPRYALIKMLLPDWIGRQFEIISDCVPYIYDPVAGTLVLSQVLQGKPDGWGSLYLDIAFTVTEGKTLVFTTEKVVSLATPKKYIQTLGLELTLAPEE